MTTPPQPQARILAKLREVLLALPGAYETTTWGHPNFRAGKKIFAAFHEDRTGVPCIWLRVEPISATLLADDPRTLRSAQGGARWVGVRADLPVDWTLVRELALEGYEGVLPKSKAKSKPKAAVSAPARSRSRPPRRS